MCQMHVVRWSGLIKHETQGRDRTWPTFQNNSFCRQGCHLGWPATALRQPRTCHVLGRGAKSRDPEHCMFWVVAPMTTQNMACSGSWGQRRLPTTQNMETSDDPEHGMELCEAGACSHPNRRRKMRTGACSTGPSST